MSMKTKNKTTGREYIESLDYQVQPLHRRESKMNTRKGMICKKHKTKDGDNAVLAL